MMIMAHMCTPLSIMRPNSEWMAKTETSGLFSGRRSAFFKPKWQMGQKNPKQNDKWQS